MRLVIYYLIAVNIGTLLIYGLDKLKARRGQWRTPESTLLLLALIGGSIGAWCGMQLFRHKTQHKKFKYGIPAILIIQFLLALWML